MIGAVLGNGPSRFAYSSKLDYDILIGCNIPWVTVDYNVIQDENCIEFWSRKKYPYKSVLSKRAYDYAKPNERLFNVAQVYDDINYREESSAHTAVRFLIEFGCTQIDIYGCDSRFDKRSYKSRTSEYISSVHIPRRTEMIETWNITWDRIISNTECEIRFVRNE